MELPLAFCRIDLENYSADPVGICLRRRRGRSVVIEFSIPPGNPEKGYPAWSYWESRPGEDIRTERGGLMLQVTSWTGRSLNVSKRYIIDETDRWYRLVATIRDVDGNYAAPVVD